MAARLRAFARYRYLLMALCLAALASTTMRASSEIQPRRSIEWRPSPDVIARVFGDAPRRAGGTAEAPAYGGGGAAAAATPCGGDGQRACTIFERVPSCNTDLVEKPGCPFGADCNGSIGHCVHPDCGRDGDRACTGLERIPSCDTGAVEVPGCTGNCVGEGGETSLGMCVTLSPCGGRGQRACTNTERPFQGPCNAGLTEVAGCTGDCFAGASLVGAVSSSMCTIFTPMSEPTTNRVSAATPSCPVSGYADLHLHLLGHMAHGGGVLAGKPYDYDWATSTDNGVNGALGQDYGSNNDLVTKGDKNTGVPRPTPTCPSYLPNCGAHLFHGDHTLFDDPTGSGIGTNDGAASNLGAPIFNGWPKWTSTTHQQVYYKWLERAWQGGLRVITQFAVTNEALCRGGQRILGADCTDSMSFIDAELDEIYRFQDFIDLKSGGTGQGWFRIVKTPVEARTVIAQGKLAVILGIEVDNLFGAKFPFEQCTATGQKGDFLTSCHFNDNGTNLITAADVRNYVQHYYDRGVRHMFPIHNFDNAFGAPATWQDAIEVGNRVSEGHWWADENCSTDGTGKSYGFKLGTFTQLLVSTLKFWPATITEVPARSDGGTSCNHFGLLPLGKVLLAAMMDHGMIIDLDHMSAKSFDDTMTEVETRSYPVVATHVLSFDMHDQSQRHERMRTKAQLMRIKNVGGMIAAMLKDDNQDQSVPPLGKKGEKHTVAYGSVPDDCRHSSKSFAQAYQYAVDVMGTPVAFGSDFDGIAGHFGPRFGSEGCGGWLSNVEADRKVERAKQIAAKNKLQYPFTLNGFGSFDRQKTGDKTFDYNYDGMAHIGLLPDFVADLKAIGMPDIYNDSIMQSAEQYIRVWERGWSHSTLPPLDESGVAACAAIGSIQADPNPVRAGRSTQFSQAGIAAGGTYSWNFGDGSTGAGASPSHTYAQPGTYNVSLTVAGRQAYSSVATSVTAYGGNPPDILLAGGVGFPGKLNSNEVGHFVLQGYATDGDNVTLKSVSCGVGTRTSGTPTDTLPGANYNTFFDCKMPPSVTQMVVTATVQDVDGETTRTLTVPKSGTPPNVWLDGPGSVKASQTVRYLLQGYSTDSDNVTGTPLCNGGGPAFITADELSNENYSVHFDCRFSAAASTVTGTVHDANGDATMTKSVTVIDDVPPSIQINNVFPLFFVNGRPQYNFSLKATSSAGAVLAYTVSANDNFDGSVPVSCATPSGTAFAIGFHSFGCSATDHAGNVGGADVSVFVFAETTPPTIVVPQAYAPQHHWRLDDGRRTSRADVALDTGFAPNLINAKLPATGQSAYGDAERAVCVGSNEHGLQLSGVSQDHSVIDFGPDVAPFGTQDYTFAFWFKLSNPSNLNSGTSRIVMSSRDDSSGSDPGSFEARIRKETFGGAFASTQYWVEVQLDQTSTQTLTLASDFGGQLGSGHTGFDPDVWHHVAVTQGPSFQPGERAITLYLDGVSQDSTTRSGQVSPNGRNLIGGGIPGAFAGGYLSTFEGALDEVEMFDRPLTEFELGTLFKAYKDTAAPANQCQAVADLEVSSAAASATATFTARVFAAVTGDAPVVATCTPASGTTFQAGPTPVTCSATDDFENAASVSFVAIVRPSTRPVISTPSDITAEATGPSGAVVTFDVTGEDSEGHTLQPTCSASSGGTFALGTQDVNCSVSDGKQTTTGSFTVSVVDTTPPAFHGVPADIVREATSPFGQSVTFTKPTATDLVDGNGVFVNCFPPSGWSFYPGFVETVSCTSTDNSFNQATATFTVTIQDTTPPVIFVPPSITKDAPGPNGDVVLYGAFATDNGSGSPVTTCLPESGSTFPVGTTHVNCTATDDVGNSSQKSFDVVMNFTDVSPPVFGPLPDLTREAAGPSGAVATFAAVATDVSGVAEGPTCLPASGSTFPIGTTTVTCTAKDTLGHAGTTTFKVKVIDTTAPVVTPPANVVVEAGAGGVAAATYGAATASDGVGVVGPVSCSPASGSSFGLGVSLVTCSAHDAAGNTGQRTFTVTVADTTPPDVHVPTALPVEADQPGGRLITFSVASFDIVDGAVATTCTPPSGTVLPVGTTVITCTATDNAGNKGTGTINAVITDTTPPSVTVPASQTLEATSPAGAVATFASATATDIVGVVGPVTCSASSGSTFPLGTTTVTCTAHDAVGNLGSASFSVTVRDTTPPSLTVPSNIVAEATSPAGATVPFSASATDIGDAHPTVSCQSAVAGSVFPLGTTPVTCTATDASGNSKSGGFTITIRDTTPPSITAPATVTLEATAASGATLAFATSATDLVDGTDPVSCTPAIGATVPIGSTSVLCTSTDHAGNTSSKTVAVTVRDTTPPVITKVTPSQSQLWPPNGKMLPVSLAVVSTDAVTASPACKVVSVTSNEAGAGQWQMTGPLAVSLQSDRLGSGNGRTYTIGVACTDAAGNTSQTATTKVVVPHDQGK